MDHLTISGPTLAAWLSVFTKCNRPCDGLLFGSVSSTTTTQAHDASDAFVVEEHEGCIVSTYACINTHSFYTNSGQVQGAQLQQLLDGITNNRTSGDDGGKQQQQLLGWFSYRPGTPCTPSMREAAVTQHLQEWLQNNSSSSSSSQDTCQRPVVFGVIVSQPDHNAATLSLQYKFFKAKHDNSRGSQVTNNPNAQSSSGINNSGSRLRQQPEHPTLQPLELRVLNLGGSHSSIAGSSSSSGSTWCAASMPALAAALQPARVLSQQQQAQVLSAAAAMSGGVVSAVDGMYTSLLDELQTQVAKVAAQQQQLHDLMAANAALQQKLQSSIQGITSAGGICNKVVEELI